jgi:hypothetical protein
VTENGAVVELLLQYMHYEKPPDLAKVPFKDLLGLAEAAHKYDVMFAMCESTRAMECVSFQWYGSAFVDSLDRKVVAEHPFEVLNWALRHSHHTIADMAAEAAVTFSPDDVLLCDTVPVTWVSPLPPPKPHAVVLNQT